MILAKPREEPEFKRFLPRGIFSQKAAVSRIEFEKRALRGGRYIVPGGMGKIWDKRIIKKVIEEDFPRTKFRGQISKKEFEKRIMALNMEKYKAKTREDKLKVERKIVFYRKKFLR